MTSKLYSVILILLVAALSAPPLVAQTSSGSIAGSVRDAQDAAVPSAAVTLVEQRQGTRLTQTADDSGRFVFLQLLPGRYDITVEAPGFKRIERKDITLVANDKITVGIVTLEVGALTESVQVTAQAVQLNTESSERSDAIVAKQIENLAVNSRSYLQLAGLATGVVSTANLTTGGHAGLANISANGQRFDHNQLTLNGIGNVDTGNNGDQMATISLEAVQEFKILTSSYQAEYGRSAGAQISVVTKSESSAFHGGGYLYHRHEGLNAHNWKTNRDNLKRELFRFNDPGYYIGGPIYIPGHFNKDKNKLFFFWSQEFQRQLKPQGRSDATFPTLAERAGNFSNSKDKNGDPVFIRDYTLGKPCNKDNQTGCFPGGVIPIGRQYVPGMAVLKFYPEPNASGKDFNYSSQISDSYPRRESLIRIDYNITPKWKLFSHYLDNKDSVTSAYGSFVLGSGFPKVPITDTRPGKSFAISVTTLINPTMTNEATFGYAHNVIHIDPVNDGLTRAKTGINVPLLFPSAVQQDFIPRFAYAGSRMNNQQQFGTNNAPFYNYNSTLDWIDNVSKVWKQHVFKAGIYVQSSRKDQTSFAASSGDINFSDNASNPFDTGFGFANMALGIFSSYNQASGYFTGKYRYLNTEWYLQDQWKLTRRLTLDYGMRFYLIQPQFDEALQTSTFLPERFDPKQAVRLYVPTNVGCKPGETRCGYDAVTSTFVPAPDIGKIVPGSGNLLNGIAQAGKGVSKYLIKNRGVHYSPRLGFAYDVTGKQNLVVRAGAAILYDRFQGNEVFDMLTNPPTTLSPTLVNGLLKDVSSNNVLLAPAGLNAFDYGGEVPTTYSYHFGIQTKLPYDFVLDTAYVGSVNRHELERLNVNAIPYGATFLPQNQDPTKSNDPKKPFGSAAKDANFLRPDPGFGDITLHQFGGTSNYNSLQTSLNKRIGRSLFFGFNWTWSRALGTTSDRGNYHRIDNLTRLANYGPLSFDRHHTVNIFYTYEIPGMFHSSFAHAFFDGWQISGGTMFQSGSPFGVGFSIPDTGNTNLTGSYTEPARIKLVGNPLSGVSGDEYHRLNPAAFAPPPLPTAFAPPLAPSIGLDSPTNYLRSPGINNTNLSIQKTFAIRESMKVDLRADAFNVFNHTQFSGINSTINYKSFTDSTVTNLPFKPDGTVNNINGFGTVNGARDPRIMQLVVRFLF